MAEDFLTMKEENRRVHKMNDSLMNLLSANFLKTDTTTLLVTDSVPFDTLGHYGNTSIVLHSGVQYGERREKLFPDQ